jgi:hypothetical protein
MSLSGAAHVVWLRSDLARAMSWPVDGGLKFRGKRLFGDNKRVCGFLVLPPASALSFAMLSVVTNQLPAAWSAALWKLDVWQYALLGLICGFAFMLAELPNSFLKRQLDIPPGGTSRSPVLRTTTLVLDRVDSVLGALIALSLCVSVALTTWLWVLVLGAVLHAAFSAALYGLGLKARAL